MTCSTSHQLHRNHSHGCILQQHNAQGQEFITPTINLLLWYHVPCIERHKFWTIFTASLPAWQHHVTKQLPLKTMSTVTWTTTSSVICRQLSETLYMWSQSWVRLAANKCRSKLRFFVCLNHWQQALDPEDSTLLRRDIFAEMILSHFRELLTFADFPPDPRSLKQPLSRRFPYKIVQVYLIYFISYISAQWQHLKCITTEFLFIQNESFFFDFVHCLDFGLLGCDTV
jgi:hypothetical protein